MAAIRYEGHVYIRHDAGDEELYDLDGDPTESHDLSQSQDSQALLERCRRIFEPYGAVSWDG